MQEEWRDVAGYEDLYQVSNLGNVRSFWCWDGHKYKKRDEPKILKPVYTPQGYQMITLYNSTKKKRISIHKLVAITFIKKPPKKNFINHIDFNRSNNNITNIEWCSQKENVMHSAKNFRYGFVDEKTTNKIIEMHKDNIPTKQIGKMLNLKTQTCYVILKKNGFTYFNKNKKYAYDKKSALNDLQSGNKIVDVSKKYNVPYHVIKQLKRTYFKNKGE